MEKLLQKFQDLKIQREEIEKATNNLDRKNYIGGGGFGDVYEGEMSCFEGRRKVAIKHLNRANGQGDAEFLKEITSLSRYRHENLISLLGFCYQGNEAFIVYELASHGSLDKYLDSPDLTWSKRIKICLDAAKGLKYLHDPRGTHQRLIHCDVKSSNILIDEQWNAKVADFGFSISGPANELQSTIVNLAAGTLGYCDPLYAFTNTLTKESDVYSFGVVLVEVLCGALCYSISDDSVEYNLVPTWIKSYEEKKLDDIIFQGHTFQPLEQSALEIFSDIAYHCLKESREDRPDMADVVGELEIALKSQELFERQLESQELIERQELIKSLFKGPLYVEIFTSAELPLNCRSKDELMTILSKGILINRGKTWFSLNKKGEHCEMISIAECLGSEFKSGRTKYKSRFPMGVYPSDDGKFKTRVKTQFLSPGITYTVNLVFKFQYYLRARKCKRISLYYKLQDEAETSASYLAYEGEDGWWIAELYQFTCDHKIVDLHILFNGFGFLVETEVEGIEFRPLENVDVTQQPISDTDSAANLEERLPTDYEDILKRSANSMQWTTKEEVYSIMSKGFLISDNKMKKGLWFSLDKNGRKCHMLPAADISSLSSWHTLLPLPESRFGEVIHCDDWRVGLKYEVQSELVSSNTKYAGYLVYKLSKDQFGFEAPMEVLGARDVWYIYLVSPQTPVIKPKADQPTHNPPGKVIKKFLPQQRNDGWMEVRLLEFKFYYTNEIIDMSLTTTGSWMKKAKGLIIEGIEIRPL